MEHVYILVRVSIITSILLLFPGYSVFLALFPKNNQYDSIQKLGLSGVLGFTLNILLGTLQIEFGIGLNLVIHLVVVALISIGALWAFVHRSGPDLTFNKLFKQMYSILKEKVDYFSNHILPLSISASLFVVGTIIFVNLPQQFSINPYTEFFVLDASNKIPFNINTNSADGNIQLTVGVVNHEREHTNYIIQVKQENSPLSAQVYLNIAEGEKWVGEIPLDLSGIEDLDQMIQIILYKNNSNIPYRQLHLVLEDNSN